MKKEKENQEVKEENMNQDFFKQREKNIQLKYEIKENSMVNLIRNAGKFLIIEIIFDENKSNQSK